MWEEINEVMIQIFFEKRDEKKETMNESNKNVPTSHREIYSQETYFTILFSSLITFS